MVFYFTYTHPIILESKDIDTVRIVVFSSTYNKTYLKQKKIYIHILLFEIHKFRAYI